MRTDLLTSPDCYDYFYHLSIDHKAKAISYKRVFNFMVTIPEGSIKVTHKEMIRQLRYYEDEKGYTFEFTDSDPWEIKD